MKFNYSLILLLATIYGIAQTQSINEERYVSIGGIEQWVTIKGEDRSKPVILFIHGGPGSTMSQFENTMYGAWEKEFVLVNWDQRGAGKTYGQNAPSEVDETYYMDNPLSVEQMTNDGIELTNYILEYLNQQKVIVVATSWGSVLGLQMILKNPDLFEAYVGHAQMVSFSRNIQDAYSIVYEMAQQKQDETALEKLGMLGKPPYNNAKSYGQLLRIVKKFERENSMAAPDSWWKIAAPYDNETDNNNRLEGDDYSFLNLVGHQDLGIQSMVLEMDFEEDALEFEIPMYFIQGEEDILTSKNINKPYFDKITAPKKEYILVPGAAHGHNQAIIDTQYAVVKQCLSNK